MKRALAFAFLLSVLGCAQTSLPEGGPVDETPPKVTSSFPDSAAIFFRGDYLELNFDEYVVLNNLTKNLIVSPPLPSPPTVKLKKKRLRLMLNDSLQPNATYQFYFGKSIKDLNEGNEAKDLKLVFSTGASIDTGRLSGQVVSAFDLSPGADMLVFLYHEYKDSQLLLDKPFYIAQTDEQGRFDFSHIQEKSYTIYAVKDANNNYLLDNEELFATLDTAVVANTSSTVLTYSKHLSEQKLRVVRAKELFAGELLVLLNQPIPENQLTITTDNHPSSRTKDNKLLWHFGESRDSIWVDLPPSAVDSFTVTLLSSEDTLVQPARRDTSVASRPPTVVLGSSIVAPVDPFALKANSFVHAINSQDMRLWDATDSMVVPIQSSTLVSSDSVHLEVDLKEGHRYSLAVNEQAIQFWNQASLTDTLHFQTSSVESTGILELVIQSEMIIDSLADYYLVLKKGAEIIQKAITLSEKEQKILFKYLQPGSYEIFVFEDLDKNKSWSGANYLKKQKSERIWWLKSKQEIRANWKNQDIPLLLE